MARCVTDDGRVLLLEHGASWFPLLRWWQRHRLNRHVVRYGCYWDRDIEVRRTPAAPWPQRLARVSAASCAQLSRRAIDDRAVAGDREGERSQGD